MIYYFKWVRYLHNCRLFPLPHHGSAVKNLPANGEDAGKMLPVSGSGRSTGGGNGNPLQYSCLGNPMERGAWQTVVRGFAKSQACEHAHSMCVVTAYNDCSHEIRSRLLLGKKAMTKLDRILKNKHNTLLTKSA